MRTRRGMRAAKSGLCVTTTHGHAALAVELDDELVHLLAGVGVEVAGRLVGEEHARLHDERARQRHALLLAAGQLARAMGQAVAEADAIEQLLGARGRPRRATGRR